MTDYKKYINALRKCAKEHENDKTFTGYIIVADLCKDTADLLEALEKEPVLDKIRAEIEQLPTYDNFTYENYLASEFKHDVLDVIDKYKAEYGVKE